MNSLMGRNLDELTTEEQEMIHNADNIQSCDKCGVVTTTEDLSMSKLHGLICEECGAGNGSYNMTFQIAVPVEIVERHLIVQVMYKKGEDWSDLEEFRDENGNTAYKHAENYFNMRTEHELFRDFAHRIVERAVE